MREYESGYEYEKDDLEHLDFEDFMRTIDRANREITEMTPVEIDGPATSREYVESYFNHHPHFRQEIPRYMHMLDRVKRFVEAKPDAHMGTYDMETYELVPDDEMPPYCVTFHQNYRTNDKYGAYDAETYAALCVIAVHELRTSHIYIGYYGNPEISFGCARHRDAIQFAVQHNQESTFSKRLMDNTDTFIKNKKYNGVTNPIVD